MANTSESVSPTFTGLTPERALLRLKQLAREERDAVVHGNIEVLCQIADLLPSVMDALTAEMFIAGGEGAALLSEIEASHKAAESYLQAQMRGVTESLRQIACTRRTLRGYSNPGMVSAGNRLSQLDGIG